MEGSNFAVLRLLLDGETAQGRVATSTSTAEAAADAGTSLYGRLVYRRQTGLLLCKVGVGEEGKAVQHGDRSGLV